MNVLSVFVDESGFFSLNNPHSPYYLVTLLFHQQSVTISENIKQLNNRLSEYGMPNHTIHTAPLIRNEGLYRNMSLFDRKRIFNALYNFARTSDIRYSTIAVEKKHCVDVMDLVHKLSKQLSSFLNRNLEELLKHDCIICYYDNGQRELARIIITAFNTALTKVEIRKVAPADYKLFQAADLLCTMELLSIKAERKMLSKAENIFFKSGRDLDKQYLRALKLKRL